MLNTHTQSGANVLGTKVTHSHTHGTHISPLFLSLSHWCSVELLNCSAPFRPPLHWICMMVWEFLTTSMRPTQSPMDRQPYGSILAHSTRDGGITALKGSLLG